MASRPHISQELINYLQHLYPERPPDINDTEREIWMHVGQVAVVRHLNMLLEEQIEHQLGNL